MSKFKILFLFYLLLIPSISVFSQNWTANIHNYSTGDVKITDALYNEANSRYFVTGNFSDSLFFGISDTLVSNGPNGIFLTAFDSEYNPLWVYEIDGDGYEVQSHLDIDDNNNIYLTGLFTSSNCKFEEDTTLATDGIGDDFIAKFHDSGDLMWVNHIGRGESFQKGNSIMIDDANDVVLSMDYQDSIIVSTKEKDTTLFSGSSGSTASVILKLNSSATNYNNIYNITTNGITNIYGIREYSNSYYFSGRFQNTVYLEAGNYTSTSSTYDLYILKTNTELNDDWVRRSYGNDNDYPGALTNDQSGNVYLTGFFNSTNFQTDSTATLQSGQINNRGNRDIFLFKYNKEGNLQWAKSYGTAQNDWAREIDQEHDIFYITGYSEGDLGFGNDTIYNQGGRDFFVGSFDTEGNKLRAFGLDQQGAGDESGMVLSIAPNNKVYTGGYFTSSSIGTEDTTFNLNGAQDMFLGKFTSELAATFSEIQQPSCNGASDGKLVVKPEFGVAPYTYTWTPDVSSDSTAENLSAGTYEVTVEDSEGSTTTISHDLGEPNPIVFHADSTHITGCYADSTGAITLDPTGGTKPYSYFWTTSDGGGLDATAEDQSGLGAGTYTVTLTDDNGCTADTTIILTQPSDMSFAGTTIDHLTNADPQGAVDLNVSGATPSYQSYSWSGPDGFSASTQDISSLTESGDYTVTVTDDNSCAFDTTVNVIDYTELDIYFDPDDVQHVSCNGGNDGRAIITVVEPATAPTYTWSGDPNDPANTNDSLAYDLTAGEYTVTVDDGDTSITESITITEPEPLDLTFTSNSTSSLDCYGDSDGIIDLDVSGGTSPYSFNWTTSDGSGLESGQEDQNGLTAGTYNVTVTDDNGCTSSASFVINEPEVLTVNAVINTEISCNGFSDGALEANVFGGTGSIAYQWNDGANQTTRIADGLSQGTYQVTVTDENGCTASDSRTLDEPEALTINYYSSSDITCNNANDGEIHLNALGGTGDQLYTVTPEGGADIENQSGDFTGLPADNYTISVSDDNACPGPERLDTLYEPDPLSIDLVESTDVTECNGDATGSINVDASGGNGSLTYTLNSSSNQDITSNGTGEFTGLTAGTYNVDVDDAEGCGPVNSGDITIDEPTALSIDDTSSTDVTCNGGADATLSVSASGGTGTYSYTLQPGGETNSTGNFTGLSAGSYYVEVRDGNDCGPISTDDIIIDEPAAINITNTSSTAVSCNGGSDGSISVTAEGGSGTLTYALQSDPSNSNTTGNFTGLTAGTYNVEVTDADGCGPVVSSDITITQPDALSFSDITSEDASCNGCGDGSINATATGGSGSYTYTLLPDDITNSTGEFTDLSVGTYTVEVNDGNDCGPVSSGDIGIGEPSEVTIVSSSSTDVSCNGSTDGVVTVEASGGNQPLIYTLNSSTDDGIATNNDGEFTGLSPDTYTVEVTDQGGYGPLTTSDLVVGEPDPVTASVSSSSDVTCFGGSNGSLNVTASGGSGSYTYTLHSAGNSDIATNSTGEFNDLGANTYTVEVVDDNGCGPVTTGDITIDEPAAISITNTSSTDVSCYDGADGTIAVTAEGGTGSLSYTLQPDGITQGSGDFTGLDDGTYTVEVTDANDCGPVTSSDIVIGQPAEIIITSSSISDVTCNGGTDGSLSVTAEGGTGDLTYTLNSSTNTNIDNNNTGEFTGLSAGTYTVEVTDANDCGPVTSSEFVINEPTAITTSVVASTDASCSGGADGSLEVSASGGSGSLTYTLQPDDISNSQGQFTGLDAGTYTVEVTDADGCGPVATEEITIGDPAPITIPSASYTDVTCPGGADGSITVSGQGGTGTYSYTLQPDGTNNETGEFTGLAAGTYTVEVTDANGCGPVDTTLTLTDPEPVDFTGVEITNVTNCASSTNGAINASAANGAGELTYTLVPGDNSATTSNATGSFSGLGTGAYTVEVSDEFGCQTIDTTVELTGPPAIEITSVDIKNVLTCAGDPNGSIEVEATGGTGSLTYSLDPGGYENFLGEFTGLTGGTYTIEVTDENGCGPVDSVVEISEPEPITINNVSSTDITGCHGDANGSVQVDASGGSGNLSYTLQPEDITNSGGSFSDLAAGTYTVEVTDANNCGPVSTNSIVLEQPDPITLDNIDTTFVSTDGAADGTITATASGGTSPLTYVLNPDSIEINQTGQFTDLAPGDYTLAVTDQNQCPGDTSDVITIAVGPDTGEDELETEYGLKIYPNPAEETVTLTMNLQSDGSKIQVHVINTVGQLQEVVRFEGRNQDITRQLNVQDYQGGVYVLKFFDDKKYLGQRTLVIRR